MMTNRSEIRQLTALRGVAALLVVIYHFRKEFGNSIHLDHYTQFFACGYLWVDFFFLLSGFVMGLVYSEQLLWPFSIQSYGSFLKMRLARIYPLHIFTLLLFLPTEAAKLFISSNAEPAFSSNSPGAFVSNLLLVQAWHLHASTTWNQPAWSISAEWAAYLLTPLLLIPALRTDRFGAFCFALLLVGGVICLDLTLGRHSLDLTYDFAVPRCLLTFSIGLLIYRFRAQSSENLKQIIGSELSVALSIGFSVLAIHYHVSDWLIVMLFSWLVCATSVRDGTITRLIAWRPLYYLGMISYSLYLDQALLQRAWQFVWYKYASHVVNAPASAMIMVALVGMTVAFADLTYRYVEVPARRNIANWSTRRKRLPATLNPS